MHQAPRFCAADLLVRIERSVRDEIGIAHYRAQCVARTFAAPHPAIVVHYPRQDAEHPSLDRAAPLELIELAIDRDVHFLNDIVDSAVDDAHSAHHAPHGRKGLGVNFFERRTNELRTKHDPRAVLVQCLRKGHGGGGLRCARGHAK